MEPGSAGLTQPTREKEKEAKELDLEKDRAKPKSDNQRMLAV